MGARTKTVLKGFDYMHCDDFAKYLMNMAAKGWHFKEWSIGLKFEKGEPEDVTYAVEVFTKASENDMRPEPHTQEFAEYCEVAGWKLIDAKQKFCIFKKVDENALELFTPEERVNNSLKGMLSGAAILLLVLYGINALLQWMNVFSFFKDQIFSNTLFFNLGIWTVMFIGQLSSMIYAYFKCRKMKKAIAKGESIYIGINKDGKFHIGMRDVYVAILIVLLLSYLFMIGQKELVLLNVFIIVATLVFAFVIAKIRPENNTNVIIQMVFSVVLMLTIMVSVVGIFSAEREHEMTKDEVPLLISDYREFHEEIDDISYYHERNLLGSSDIYFIYGEEKSIHYKVYRSEYTKILDKIWEEEVYGREYNEGAVDGARDWKAEQAFRNKIGTYYVRYENIILVFNDYEDVYLSVEQINIIRDKLDLR